MNNLLKDLVFNNSTSYSFVSQQRLEKLRLWTRPVDFTFTQIIVGLTWRFLSYPFIGFTLTICEGDEPHSHKKIFKRHPTHTHTHTHTFTMKY